MKIRPLKPGEKYPNRPWAPRSEVEYQGGAERMLNLRIDDDRGEPVAWRSLSARDKTGICDSGIAEAAESGHEVVYVVVPQTTGDPLRLACKKKSAAQMMKEAIGP